MGAKLTELLAEVRANQRLRLGIWLVAAILGGYLILLVHDQTQAQVTEYRRLQDRLQRLEAVAAQPEWIQRADAARVWNEKVAERLWRSTSRGLAQAEFQSWLDLQLMFSTLEQPRVRVEPALDVPGYPGMWQVTAQIDTKFKPAGLESFLEVVARNDKLINVDRLDIRTEGETRVSLTLRAYFAAPPAG